MSENRISSGRQRKARGFGYSRDTNKNALGKSTWLLWIRRMEWRQGLSQEIKWDFFQLGKGNREERGL